MNIDWASVFNWMSLLKCFVVGGLICVIGQILIDKTKLTPARILVIYVSLGSILGGLGLYKYLIDFAGCGATVPLTGFGSLLAKGTIEEIQNNGLIGILSGGLDGIFGTNTHNSVLNYQRTRGLTVDGIVGNNTWRTLMREVVGTGSNSNTIN